MPNGSERWLEEAAGLPIAFAQVREDARLDTELLDELDCEAPRVLLVASGGCTAAALATARVGKLHLVDINPAQIALSRLKLALLRSTEPRERRALLGHDAMPPEQRKARLLEELRRLDLVPSILGPIDRVAELGPAQAGRYERLFARLREVIQEEGGDVAPLMQLRDPVEQAQAVAPETPLGRALDVAFDRVMALPNLVRLFGARATANRVQPFARHFAERTRHVLATLPAADNPYLAQVLLGRYPPGVSSPWLSAPRRARLPVCAWTVCDMVEAMKELPRASFDFVHLSNFLDWLTPPEATQALDLADRVLAPGGMVFVRQLNSAVAIPAAGRRFTWDPVEAAALHERDRSFFYRALHIGRKA
jgi:S-adenosylmethionine-diacylglycerol 3-amino-3-carboxypropyl transferase